MGGFYFFYFFIFFISFVGGWGVPSLNCMYGQYALIKGANCSFSFSFDWQNLEIPPQKISKDWKFLEKVEKASTLTNK